MSRKTLPHSLALLLLLACCLAAPLISGQQPPSQPNRESIEWCDIWITHGNDAKLPRVLLIGDSITRGYYNDVDTRLKDRAAVCRLATSKALGDPALLDEIRLVLSQYHFDVVHFNNGLHGWANTEAQYREHFPELLATIRKYAPDAKLIWATTTPTRNRANLKDVDAAHIERVKARNKIAAEAVAKEKIPTDDLFALVKDHPEYYAADGTHFNPAGTSAEGEQVAKVVAEQLAQSGAKKQGMD